MPRLTTPYDWKLVVFQIRQLRRETQAELADALDCSVSTVSKWEQGQTTPAPRQRRRLEEYAVEAGFPPSHWPEDVQQPLFPVAASA